MAGLRIGVLGPLEVEVDGRARHVPPGRRRAVLARLVVDAGHPVTADALIDAAWPAELPRHPTKALQTVLSRLRATLGPDAVEATPTGYRLVVAAEEVDADRFERLVERAADADPPDALDLLDRALGLWRGRAYQEHEDTSFAALAARRLDARRADAIEARAEAVIAVGDPAATVADLEGLLAEEPFRERAVELLALALYHAGRPTDALGRLRAFRERMVDELGLDASPALDALEHRILGHTVPAADPLPDPAPGRRGWLDPSTAFIGRDGELAEVTDAVAGDRVTVITGPGGAGKSRLASEVLRLGDPRLALPTTVVELAPVPPGSVVAAVADALGLRSEPFSRQGDVVEYLAGGPHLLVLDGCERVIDEVTPLVATIERRCRDVRVLATSRRRLGVASERVVPLPPLDLPDPASSPGAQAGAGAIRLFTDRVRRLRPSFTVTDETVADVAGLCRWCDGLPLVLEVAASRAATVGVPEVLARLPVEVVGAPEGDLHAVVEWSTDLLAPEERGLLEVLSAFAGDFDAEDVRSLARGLPWWQGDPTAALAELVESSLVVRRQVEDDAGRYGLLEMVRAHAAHGLATSGREEATRRAHAEWVRATAVDIRHRWADGDGAEVSERLRRRRPDVAAAIGWLLEIDDLVTAAAIAESLGRCLHWTPGPALGDLLIEVGERGSADGDPRLAAAVGVGAFLAAERGEAGRARALADASLRAAPDPEAGAMATLALAVLEMYAGDLDASVGWYEAMAAVPSLAGEAHTSLALIACYRDDLAVAREHIAVALASRPMAGDASHAFARYAEGEVVARADPERGADLLAATAAEADRVDAEQVGRVARVALLALRVRAGRHRDAATLGTRLIGDLRRQGAWIQAWTTVRLVAELLADLRRWADAAFLLSAAELAPDAPPPVGEDVARYVSLRTDLDDRLGGTVTDHIRTLAAAPRSQVLSRAERMLDEVRATGDEGP